MEKKQGIGFYEKYLTIWVALCIVIGIAVGQWLPVIPQTLSKLEYANVVDTRSYPDMVNDLPDDAKSGFSKR